MYTVHGHPGSCSHVVFFGVLSVLCSCVSFLCVSEVEVVIPFCSFLYIYLSLAGMLYTIIPCTCTPLSQFSRLGTLVSWSSCVCVFVQFVCGVLGLSFLSSLPLRLT